MKHKFIKIIIPVFLLCFILSAYLSACKKDDGNNNNIGENINNAGDSRNPVESEAVNDEAIETKYTSKEIADAIIAAYSEEDIPEDTFFEYFFSGVDENSENYLDPEKAGRMINGNSAAVKEFDYLEDYAFYVPIGNHFFEVDVVKIKEGVESNLDAVRDIFEKRIKRKDNGDIRFYVQHEVPLIENAKIVTAGRYVILLVTTDNGKADGVINNMLKSGSNSGLENNADKTDNTGEEQGKVIENRPAPAFMGEVVNIESEILFDFDILADIEFSVKNQEESTDTDVDVRRTAVPRVDVKKHSHNTSFIIGGKCEVGAMIRVTGGTEEIYTGSDYGNYLVEVPFAEEGMSTLRLTAEMPGKAPSQETVFILKARKDVDLYEKYGTFGVIVGYNFMTYFDDCLPDYIGDNLINDKEIAAITTRTEKKIGDLRDKGCNAEIIYLLVPNTVRTWAEDMPRRYIYEKSDTLLRQWKKGVTDGGATVLDLSDVMMAHKNDEYKIWHKTDSHWTEYGAYLAYVELMNYIAQRFSDAAPRPRSDFEFYNMETDIGDIYMRLEIEVSDLKETTSFARFNFDPPHFNPDFNKGHLGMDLYERGNIYIIHDRLAFEHTTKSNVKGNLPSVYVMRDSFEGCLHAFYTDRFSTATFQSMWSYGYFDTKEISRLNPDYILYVISERNLKNVLYN